MKKTFLLSVLLLVCLALSVGCGGLRYNVDFYVDGEIYKSVGTDGKTVEMPSDPIKEGYVFDGWYTKENGKGELVTLYTLLDQPLSEDIRLSVYAHFLRELTVTYVTGTGEVIKPVSYKEGDAVDKVTPRTVPENMLFDGWYTDENRTDKWDYGTKLTSNLTLYAGWVSAQVALTYDFNMDGLENKTVTVNRFERTEAFTPDPIPDYEFIGWYKDEACTRAFDFENDAVDEDLTLYAKWQSDFVTVTFDYQLSQFYENENVRVRRGTAVEEITPSNIPAFYEFLGWYKKTSYYSEQWDFSSVITQDVTIYAHWINHEGNPANVTLMRMEDGESHYYNTVYTTVGSVIGEMDVYVPDGKELVGWFRDEACTQPWNITTDVVGSEEMTLYAKIDYIYVTVTLKADGFIHTETVKYGDVVNLPAVGDRQDYYVDGWKCVTENNEEIGTYTKSYSVYRLENVTLNAIYKSIFKFSKTATADAYELTSISSLVSQQTVSVPAEYDGLPVKRIAASACVNRNGFSYLIIPDSVEYIGSEAFAYCYNLQEVTVGRGVKEISNGVFNDCRSLARITFTGNSLTALGYNVFFNTAITSLALPASLETFVGVSYCEKLADIDLGKIKHLTGNFTNTALKQLFIPKTVETITADISTGADMIIFAEAESKPDGWVSNWNSRSLPVVWGVSGSSTLNQNGLLFAATNYGATLIRCESTSATVTVPQSVTVNGTQYPVTEIGSNAFYNLQNLQSVSLPDTLERVAVPQFIGCNSLNYHVENGVKYLGNANNPYLILADLTANQSVLRIPAQTQIILGHSSLYYYTTYTVKSFEFEENSRLKSIGSSFFGWSGDSDKTVYLPSGIKYMDDMAFVGKNTSVFVPEESKPSGWAENCFGTNLKANVYYGVAEDDIYKTGEGVYLLQNGEATLICLFGDGTGECKLPSAITVNGEGYTLTKIGTYALTHLKAKLDCLFVPETVKYFEDNYDTSSILVDTVYVEAEEIPDTWSDKWQPFGLRDNCVFLGVPCENVVDVDDVRYVAFDNYAMAYLYTGGATASDNAMIVLPEFISVNGKELTVSHLHRSFIESATYVAVILLESVTDIPAGKTYGYGASYYTTHATQPEGWVDGWNETFSGYIPVTYGLTGFTATDKTYTFVTEGTAVEPITAYFLAKSPTTTVSGKYFWGWYEDTGFSGKPIDFPYMGNCRTLYARFESTMIKDGKSFATAYDLTVGSYQSVTVAKAGEIVYFKYTATASQTCLFKSRGDYDTYGVIYQPTSIGLSGYKVVAEADGGGSGENFSVSYAMSRDFTYYFALRMVDGTQTGTFEFIVTLA